MELQAEEQGGEGGPDAGVETGSRICVMDMCNYGSSVALQLV